MNVNISDEELRLLALLHEHARGYDERFPFNPKKIGKELSVDDATLVKAASYLASHRLIGMATTDTTTFESSSFVFEALWLTGLGEDYMRELENQPGIGKKITLKVVKEMGSALRTIAITVLTELVTKGHV